MPTDRETAEKWLEVSEWIPFVATAIYAALILVSGFTIPTPYSVVSIILIMGLAFCHLVIGSIKVINEQELALLIFFGVILKPWSSGPHYALAPFYYVRRETKNSIQVDFGTLDDKKVQEIERARRAEKSQSWYVMTEPVRINWGDMRSLGLPAKEMERYENDPFASTLTTDPHFYFRIRITDLQLLIEEVGGLTEALERIRVTCIRALSEEAGKTFVAKARQELDSLSGLILERVEDLVGDPNPTNPLRVRANVRKSWGIDVEEAAIQDIGAPHDANSALAARAAAIAKADGDATAKIRTAIAEREKTEQEAAGQAKATELKAEADKKRLTLVGEGEAAALKVTAAATMEEGAQFILRIQALEKMATASGGKIVVVPSDLSSLTGVLAAAVETIKP